MNEDNESFHISYGEITTTLEANFEITLQEKGKKLFEKLGITGKFVSLLLCPESTIQELNAVYRGKDKPTDVLSWEDDGKDFLPVELQNSLPWGELAICLEICEKQAKEHQWSFEVEFYRLLVHGLVHLAGYDHEISEEEEKQMLEIELGLLDVLGLSHVYQN